MTESTVPTPTTDAVPPPTNRVAQPPRRTPEQSRKVALASFAGSAMEWYDFFLFTTAAALVFNTQYFSSENPVTATLASFGTLAVGFAARPVGGLLFGRLGDRVGRKKVLTTTILLIGASTVLIGLLPNYYSIGLIAPTVLIVLRVIQGLALGGEWGGSVIIAAENAPAAKRALYASIPQLGSPVGTILSSGAFFITAAAMSESNFESWGWRIPFLIALPLLGVAVYARSKLEESPEFEALKEADALAESPIRQVFQFYWRQVLVGTSIMMIGTCGFYLVTTFVVSYGKRVLGLSASTLLLAVVLGAVIEIPILLLGGRWGTKYGSARVIAWSAITTIVLAGPIFWAISTGHPGWVSLGIILGIAAPTPAYAVVGASLTSLFTPDVRYSGVAISANFSAVLAGCVPLVATAILTVTGDTLWPSAPMLIVISSCTLAGALSTPRLSVKEDGLIL